MKILPGIAAALTLVLATGVSAHHSTTMFDRTRTVTISGRVRAFEWTNPHVWIWVDVPDRNGRIVSWGLESANRSMAQRQGMNRNSFRPGEQVTVVLNPFRDGKPGGNFRKATFADGRVLEFPSGPSRPAGAGAEAGVVPAAAGSTQTTSGGDAVQPK